MDDSFDPVARIVREEEALLERVRGELARATPRGAGPDRDTLRALRDEAMAASEDDLPAAMHELGVRHLLATRDRDDALPDPSAPYFAHLRVRDQRGARDYLLGHRSFLDARVIDWRTAPIARVFHECREGDPFEEEINGRVVEGVVDARRIVVIERGRLTQIITDERVLVREGDGWRARERTALAPGGAEITALLDREQHAAVFTPAERALLVLGSAGSGKTTVALHRLARVAADVRYARARVLVPGEGLARLSRRLLRSIGGATAEVATIDDWTRKLAREVFGSLPPLCVDAPGLVVSLKRSPALYRALPRPPGELTFAQLRRRLATLFTDHAFLGEVVRAGGLPRSAIDETIRHTRLQLAERVDRQLRAVTVADMKRAVDGREIADATPDELAGTVDLEDLPILLYLRDDAVRASIAHLVVDEAEDVSHFELHVAAKQLSGRSVTLAGDELQQTTSGFAGWDDALRALGAVDPTITRLTVSYRCPRAIVELANHILGEHARETRAVREGAPIERLRLPDIAQADLYVRDAARDLARREPRASIAILTRDEERARAVHALFDHDARLALEGELSFTPGIDVLDVDSSKGLEFDYVIATDASPACYPDEPESRRRLHVAVTRAVHQLWLVTAAAWSPLLPPSDT